MTPGENEAPDVDITVTLYGEGGSMVSMTPVDDRRKVDLLRRAADALFRAMGSEITDRRPVHCPLCGVPTTGVRAAPDDSTVLEPCGHVVA